MKRSDACNKNEISIERNIAPWSLPNEGIPLHIKIKKETLFDTIVIHLPDDIELVETINIGDYEINKKKIIIHSIKKTDRFCENFFGLVVKYIKTPESLKVKENIIIEVMKDDLIVYSFDMECRIFRPLLELIRTPKPIELSNDNISKDVPLELQYVGFGDIQIMIEAKIGGKIVSHGESLIHEIISRLSEKRVLDDEQEKLVTDTKNGLSIDPSFIGDVVGKVQEIIEEGKIPLEIMDEKDITDLRDYMADLKKRGDFTEIIFGEVNTLLIGILKDVLERNPEENIELKDAKTRIRTEINAPIDKIQLKIKYIDILKNEYKPIEVVIDVNDKLTSHKDARIEMPIKIEKIDNNPFFNVQEMNMED